MTGHSNPSRLPGGARRRLDLRLRIARWWLPDDVVSDDALPMTAIGKVSKIALRERFRDHLARQTQ